MTNDEGMTKRECNVLALARAHARNQTSEVQGQNSSLFGNGRLLAAKDILLDLARRCFWQLGYDNRTRLHSSLDYKSPINFESQRN